MDVFMQILAGIASVIAVISVVAVLARRGKES